MRVSEPLHENRYGERTDMSAIRILIVDDMETNRVILEQIIKDMGY